MRGVGRSVRDRAVNRDVPVTRLVASLRATVDLRRMSCFILFASWLISHTGGARSAHGSMRIPARRTSDKKPGSGGPGPKTLHTICDFRQPVNHSPRMEGTLDHGFATPAFTGIAFSVVLTCEF